MKKMTIEESGMTFGPYPNGYCFHIEESKTYAAVGEGVKIAEFLLLLCDIKRKQPLLWVVEAKKKVEADFDSFIDAVHQKLVNSFSLGWASTLKRHPQTVEEVPEPFRKLDLSRVQVRFALVLKESEDKDLPPVLDAMKQVLRPTVQTWALGHQDDSVVVVNEEGAKKCGLIQQETAAFTQTKPPPPLPPQ